MRSTQRKRILKHAAVAVGALLAMGSVASAQQTVSVGGIYGGVWADSIRASFLEPYGAKSKVQLKIEEGISGVTLAKLRQQKDNPQFDAKDWSTPSRPPRSPT
jgi:putative spermidine/putrescine transport system substrate-binding protein